MAVIFLATSKRLTVVVSELPVAVASTSVYDNVSTRMLACNAIAAEKPSLW
jgi:hypothetical protein